MHLYIFRMHILCKYFFVKIVVDPLKNTTTNNNSCTIERECVIAQEGDRLQKMLLCRKTNLSLDSTVETTSSYV